MSICDNTVLKDKCLQLLKIIVESIVCNDLKLAYQHTSFSATKTLEYMENLCIPVSWCFVAINVLH